MTATVLPDAEKVVLWLLRDVLPSEVTIAPNQPADVATMLPYLVARRTGGGAVDGRRLDSATFDLQAYATTRQGARDLCADACLVLFDAWHRQTVADPTGHIASDSELTGPTELPSDIAGVWRFQAQHSLLIRP